MTFFRKYWYLFTLALITAGLAVATYITSSQLAKTTPVAPTVPQEVPRASQACTINFQVSTPSISPTSSPTNSPTGTLTPTGTQTNTPTGTRTPTVTPSHSPTSTPSNSPTSTPTNTPTNTPIPQCGTTCSAGETLPNLTCSEGKWVLTQCLQSGVNCSADKCSIVPTNTPTPTRVSSCNSSCTVDSNCPSGLVCVGGSCRNASCTNKTNCTCDIAQATPTPVTPATPVSGVFPLAAGIAIIAGIVLLLLGLAL